LKYSSLRGRRNENLLWFRSFASARWEEEFKVFLA
jgi:hypothetical protein